MTRNPTKKDKDWEFKRSNCVKNKKSELRKNRPEIAPENLDTALSRQWAWAERLLSAAHNWWPGRVPQRSSGSHEQQSRKLRRLPVRRRNTQRRRAERRDLPADLHTQELGTGGRGGRWEQREPGGPSANRRPRAPTNTAGAGLRTEKTKITRSRSDMLLWLLNSQNDCLSTLTCSTCHFSL